MARHTKEYSRGMLRCGVVENGASGLFGYRSAASTFSFCLSPFLIAITHIGRMCAQEQMIWIDAWRKVTAVTDIHSLWNGASMYHPRRMRGGKRTTLPLYARIIPRILFDPANDAAAGWLRNRVVLKTLLQCPVFWALKSCVRIFLSHVLAPLQQRLIRAGVHASNVARLAFNYTRMGETSNA